MTHAISIPDIPAIPTDGILPASPRRESTLVGISQEGQFYLYGPTPSQPGPTIEALMGVVTDVSVGSRGGEGSRYGARDYLDVRLQAPDPSIQYVIALPAHRSQWSYRTLLGALLVLDLSATALKLEPTRGREEATFIQVSLDPEGRQRVIAEAIGPDRNDLEIAVNACRRNLNLEPQFL